MMIVMMLMMFSVQYCSNMVAVVRAGLSRVV